MSVPRMVNFRKEALDAGKDPATMPILVEHFVVVGKAEAEETASYWRFIPRLWQTYVNEPDPQVINNRADVETTLEEVYAPWPVSTAPAVHIAALQKFFDNGATQVYVHFGQFDQYGVIDFYGRHVLPQLRASDVLGTRRSAERKSTAWVCRMGLDKSACPHLMYVLQRCGPWRRADTLLRGWRRGDGEAGQGRVAFGRRFGARNGGAARTGRIVTTPIAGMPMAFRGCRHPAFKRVGGRQSAVGREGEFIVGDPWSLVRSRFVDRH